MRIGFPNRSPVCSEILQLILGEFWALFQKSRWRDITFDLSPAWIIIEEWKCMFITSVNVKFAWLYKCIYHRKGNGSGGGRRRRADSMFKFIISVNGNKGNECNQ